MDLQNIDIRAQTFNTTLDSIKDVFSGKTNKVDTVAIIDPMSRCIQRPA
jgi:hypothetical protein